MELLRKSKKILFGGLAGSFITLSGPVSPIGFNQETYTIEELSYQSDWNQSQNKNLLWDFQWTPQHGFILQRSTPEKQQSTAIRKAVFRMLKD